jgi:hypothetical protein
MKLTDLPCVMIVAIPGVTVIGGSTARLKLPVPVAPFVSVTVTLNEAARLEVVAVPVTTPLVDMTSPAGSVAVKVSGASPPVAVAAVKVVDLPWVMMVGELGVTRMDASTARLKEVVPVAPLASVTVTVKGAARLEAVAVPVTIPLVDMTKPVGKAVVAAKLSGVSPPLAVAAVKVVDLPWVIVVGNAGVTVIDASTVRLRVPVAVPPFTSVTVTV